MKITLNANLCYCVLKYPRGYITVKGFYCQLINRSIRIHICFSIALIHRECTQRTLSRTMDDYGLFPEPLWQITSFLQMGCNVFIFGLCFAASFTWCTTLPCIRTAYCIYGELAHMQGMHDHHRLRVCQYLLPLETAFHSFYQWSIYTPTSYF